MYQDFEFTPLFGLDGVVSVSDAKATRIQQPGELLSVGIGPGSTLESSAEVRNFILSEIPVSVAEEMRKYAGLAARILASVPVSIGADGARTYADAAYFNEHITGIDDVKVFAESLKKVREETTGGSSDPTPTPDPDPDPKECPYADGSKGGELYYIREVISDGYYKAIAYRYNTTAGKFEFRGLTNFDAGAGSNHKAGEWVHYHIMDGFVGVCTQNGDSAELPVLHTVKFDVNGQTVDYPPEDQEIADGQTAYNAYVSDTAGCTFDGWFTEKECVNKWDFSTPVTKDLTLYAHWLPKTMTICMVAGADGTGGPESVDLTYGASCSSLRRCPHMQSGGNSLAISPLMMKRSSMQTELPFPVRKI